MPASGAMNQRPCTRPPLLPRARNPATTATDPTQVSTRAAISRPARRRSAEAMPSTTTTPIISAHTWLTISGGAASPHPYVSIARSKMTPIIDGDAWLSVNAGETSEAGCTASCQAAVVTAARTETVTAAIASFPPARNACHAARLPRKTRTATAISTIHRGPVVRARPQTSPAASASHQAARCPRGSVAARSATHHAIPAADSAPLVLIADITSTEAGPMQSAIDAMESGPGRARIATTSDPRSSSAAMSANASRPSNSAAVVDVARRMARPAGIKMNGWRVPSELTSGSVRLATGGRGRSRHEARIVSTVHPRYRGSRSDGISNARARSWKTG